jgi:hypothetical protein
MTTSLRVGLVSVAFLAAQPGLFAQPQQPGVYGQPPIEGNGLPVGEGAEAEDVPGRGVARVSLINGDVTVKRGDSGDVIAAAINAPLVASDRVLTGPGARTELQLDAANRLRIAADSDLRLAEIEYRRYMVELGRGTLTWHVSKGSAADIDINTPSVSIRPTQPGDYRITVNDDGTTTVTARTGEAEIYSPRGVEKVRRGRTTLVRGERTDPEFQTIAEIREDEWDRFNLDRDRELDRSESARYLPEGMVGGEELDQNGDWVDSAPYGRVWQPRVADGWSPYSQGRWAWTDYYGWTWVSYDQFGWAPFHYGSWFSNAGRWCWYPGPRYTRTWWRPAMVAWFGFGSVRVGVGFGNWGWVPLAPFERFLPWYGRGYYGNNRTNIHANIRIVNNYNIVNNYRNARVNGGARSIEAGQFGRVGGRYDRVGEANLRSAGLMQGQLPAAPTRESLAFNDRRVNNSGTRGGYEGAFYNRRTAATQERIPFAEQQRGIERITRDSGMRGGSLNAGAPDGGTRGDAGIRGGSSLVADSTGGRVDSGTRGENGWRRVGERPSGRAEGNDAVRGGGDRGTNSSRQTEGNGWRRFGEPASSDGVRGGARGGSSNSNNGSSREVDSTMRGGGSSAGNGWRRFGEPSSANSTNPPDSSSFRRSEGTRGSGDGDSSGSRGYRERQNSERGSSVRQRSETNPENRPDSIRVNPPVVRDRSDSGWRGGTRSSDQGGFSNPGERRGGGGQGQYRSAPVFGGSAVRESRGSSDGGMRGGRGSFGGGGGMRGGDSAPSGGNPGGSRGSGGGGTRGGGGRRGN